MKLKRNLVPVGVLMVLLLYFSCRKIELQSNLIDQAAAKSRFYNGHPPVKPSVQSIANFIKRQDERQDFSKNIINRIGFPRWDKAITVASNGLLQRTASNATELTYIPFVRENEHYVNASLLVQTSSTDTLYKYIVDWQYQNAPSGTINDTTATAEKIAATLIVLDNEVFDHKIFRLTDTTLFNEHLPVSQRGKQKVVTVNTNNTSSTGRTQLMQTTTICIRVQTGQCTCADPSNCDMCLMACAWELCLDFEYDDGTGWGSGGTGGTGGTGQPGGTSGGGGSGGGWTPPQCPFTASRTSLLPAPCLPGWIPYPGPANNNNFPHNPCKVVDSLMTTQNFPLYFSMLRDSLNLNYEKGYMFKNPLSASTTFEEVNGVPGTLGVDINPAVPFDGVVHNHYNDSLRLPVFSFDDFYKLYEWFKTGKIADLQTFIFGMVSDSSAYIMMITNPAAFTNFGNTFLNTKENIKAFKSLFYDGYGIHESNSVAKNEKGFLNALQGLSSGISLFKANDDLTQFTRIHINASDQVVPFPCNFN